MPQGISLHVAVNQYRPRYADAPNLDSCHNDAHAMFSFAKGLGYKSLDGRSNVLLDESANVPAVLDYIESASKILRRGDVFLLTFSGHGSQIDDNVEDREFWIETDRTDEVFCLYDDPLIDDVAYGYLAKFDYGVRIFAVIDSCNSGSRAELFRTKRHRLQPDDLPDDEQVANTADVTPPSVNTVPAPGTPKTIRKEIIQEMVEDVFGISDFPNDFIGDLRRRYTDSSRTELRALVAIYTACQSNQSTTAGKTNELSLFTKKFVETWNGKHDCFDFHRALKATAPVHSDIVPDFKFFKPRVLQSEHFLRKTPFVI